MKHYSSTASLVAFVAFFITCVSVSEKSYAGGDGVVIAGFDVDSPNPSSNGIKNIKFTGAQLSGTDEENRAAAKYVTSETQFDAIDTIIPDDSKEIADKTIAEASTILPEVSATVNQTISVPRKTFPEWFKSNQFVLSVMVFEFTLVTGEKYIELLKTPQPLSQAAMIAASILTGGVVISIEWNFPRILNLLAQHGSYMKQLFNNISAHAKSEIWQKKVQKQLEGVWQYTKTSLLNYGVFNALKLVLFATVASNETVKSTFLAMEADLLIKGFGAAAISYPTTKLIIAYQDSLIKKAAGSPEQLSKISGKVRLPLSIAFTERALAYGMKIVGKDYNRPMLATIGNRVLWTVAGASAIKYIVYDRLVSYFCNQVLDPLSAKQVDQDLLTSERALPDASENL